MSATAAAVTAAEVVVPASDLSATLAFFTDTLGFRIETIFPAEHPEVAVVSGWGVRLRLDATATGPAPQLRLRCADPTAFGDTALTAPNGAIVHLVPEATATVVPPLAPSFVLTRAADTPWGVGRAGMHYRDLVPDRQGGRFVASHIRIPGAGPVPDYVHYHRVRFQMIYCARGWVRLVYQDQGEPFVLQAGDCVLQPPEIRHRVLESGDDLEVIEVGCPAVHETHTDPATHLPTGVLDPGRDFGGQRFVRHVAATASWGPWRFAGYECRTVGFGPATAGLAEARAARPLPGANPSEPVLHDGELALTVVLEGAVTLARPGEADERLQRGDCVVVPAGMAHAFVEPSADLEMLDVTLPADLPQVPA